MRPIVVIVVVAVVAAGAVGLGFELSSSNASSNAPSVFNTTSSTTSMPVNPTSFCTVSGPNLGFVTPLQSGNVVFIKITTDQGAIVNNGSVLVTHTAPYSLGSSNGTADYCLHLRPNATGYMPISANDSLPQGGSYNLRLIAGYDAGKSFQAAIPGLIFVQSGETTYVSISIPSAQMTTVTCKSSGCTTTISMSTTTVSPTTTVTRTTLSGALTTTVTVTRTTTVQNTGATTTTTSCSHTATVTVTTTATSYTQTTSGEIIVTITTTVNSTVTNYGSNTVTRSDCVDTTATVITTSTVTK